MKITSYLQGRWIEGGGEGVPLRNPVTGEVLAYAGSDGVDLAAALDYARNQAGPRLRQLSYAGRARGLAAAAEVLIANRDRYQALAQANSGNTPADAAVDIDGGIGTLQYFAGLGQGLGEACFLREPGMARLARDKAFQAVHVLTPLTGVAIHINAFNFPSWGLWEKAAVALLAGVPVVAKPATATCLLSWAMVQDVIAAGVLPEGCLSLLCGGGHDLMKHVKGNDAVMFTGSADTAVRLRSEPQVVASNVRFNVEADSINCVLLGEDVTADSPLLADFVSEVVREMIVKAGQKCTAIRRILVPIALLDTVREVLLTKLACAQLGLPGAEGVRVGPLVNKAQQQAALTGIGVLRQEAELLCGGDIVVPEGADPEHSCYLQPTLLLAADPLSCRRIHDTEVFGPVATLMPYDSAQDAFLLAAQGGGSLACSVFTNNPEFATSAALALAPHHGRVLLVDDAVAASHTGHGIVMPQCVHGGPGRAGGGEELGGLRGLAFYHRRTAVQGDVVQLEALLGGAAEYVLS